MRDVVILDDGPDVEESTKHKLGPIDKFTLPMDLAH